MIELVDQMNRTIRLEETPKRIVSLVPSQTELLYSLGCEDQVVGITKFCIHPKAWFRSKTRVGGTKNVNFATIKKLKPDLIIANKEENAQSDIDQLMDLYPVYMSDIFTVAEACKMIEDVGVLTGKKKEALKLVADVKHDFSNLPRLKGKVLYFIWANPYMVVGSNTFIGHILEELGFENGISDRTARYVELSPEEILRINPDYLLLSSEPFPFDERYVADFKSFTHAPAHLVDGELFSWYGSRMLEMKPYFEQLKTNFGLQN